MPAELFSGKQICAVLNELGISHVISVPDSTLGQWEPALRADRTLQLVRVCREGEAWAIAAGLQLGGARPILIVQCTGLFESGDALRNAVYDYQLPLYALVGYRNFLNRESGSEDTCLQFTEPILRAWRLEYTLIDQPNKLSLITSHYHACRSARRAGVALIAEGRG